MTEESAPQPASAEPYEHAYKIAPLGRRVRVSADGGSAILKDGPSGRVLRTFSLHGVKGGRWSETQMRYTGVPALISRALILKGAHGNFTLRQSDGRPDIRTPNSGEFHAACAEILRQAAALNPDLRLGLGPARYVRALMAVIGAASALLGLLAFAGGVLALLTGAWLECLVFFAVALASGATGLLTALSFNPFQKQQFIAPADLAADLAARTK